MPAKSKSQQRAAGAALAAKRGEADEAELRGAAKEMFESMTEPELEDIAATPHDDLPETVEDDWAGNRNEEYCLKVACHLTLPDGLTHSPRAAAASAQRSKSKASDVGNGARPRPGRPVVHLLRHSR